MPHLPKVLRLLQETVDRQPSPRQIVRITAAPNTLHPLVVPRLSTFYERHPNIGVLIDASAHYINLADEPFDVAIRHGRDGAGSAQLREPLSRSAKLGVADLRHPKY